jgi:hypothetical protein
MYEQLFSAVIAMSREFLEDFKSDFTAEARRREDFVR